MDEQPPIGKDWKMLPSDVLSGPEKYCPHVLACGTARYDIVDPFDKRAKQFSMLGAIIKASGGFREPLFWRWYRTALRAIYGSEKPGPLKVLSAWEKEGSYEAVRKVLEKCGL